MIDGNLLPARILQMKAARGLDAIGAAHIDVASTLSSENAQRARLADLQGRLDGRSFASQEMRDAIPADLRVRMILRGHEEACAGKAARLCLKNTPVTETSIAA